MTDLQRELAENNMGLAVFLAKKYWKQSVHPDRDDEGTAMEALCRAAISYKPGAVPFSAYASRIICNAFLRIEQLAAYVKNGGGAVVDSLDRVVFDGKKPLTLGDTITAPEGVWESVVDREILREIQRVLDATEYRVACMLMDGYKQAEIAKAMGVSKSRVAQKVKTLRQKIERGGIL